jgi:diaminopimelate epimerase
VTLPFSKAEGIGNDFVVVDLRGNGDHPDAAAVRDPAVVGRICDRHFGVGADGMLAILPSASADARMRVLNADGSEAEMCGNGIRCVAKILYETDPALRRGELRIETGAGVLTCGLEVSGGLVGSVSVDMGRPRLTRDEIPLAPGGNARVLREPIWARGREFRFTAVSMGNPHAVIFVDDAGEDLRALATTYGATLEVDARFPRRTNVEFARVRRGTVGIEIDLVVWERGSGLTLACGTGACATAVAANLEERIAPGLETSVHLPGGKLAISVAAGYLGVQMRGGARTVFSGELDLARFIA